MIYVQRARPRYVWRWGGAWPSAKASTMARYGAWGTCGDCVVRLGEQDVVPGVSGSPFLWGIPWRRLASKIRSCWDVRHGTLPSDPRLRRGRIPVFLFIFEIGRREQKKKCPIRNDSILHRFYVVCTKACNENHNRHRVIRSYSV